MLHIYKQLINIEISIFFLKKKFDALFHFNQNLIILIQNINVNTIVQFQIEFQQPINYIYNTMKQTVQITPNRS